MIKMGEPLQQIMDRAFSTPKIDELSVPTEFDAGYGVVLEQDWNRLKEALGAVNSPAGTLTEYQARRREAVLGGNKILGQSGLGGKAQIDLREDMTYGIVGVGQLRVETKEFDGDPPIPGMHLAVEVFDRFARYKRPHTFRR